MSASLVSQYNSLLRQAERENARNAPPYPTGYFKSESRSGNPLGLGFFCQVCKLVILNGAKEVRHCKRTDLPPTGFWARFRLKTYRLGSRRRVA
jgi:hypothetical protein